MRVKRASGPTMSAMALSLFPFVLLWSSRTKRNSLAPTSSLIFMAPCDRDSPTTIIELGIADQDTVKV
jgi:hypothetical protein